MLQSTPQSRDEREVLSYWIMILRERLEAGRLSHRTPTLHTSHQRQGLYSHPGSSAAEGVTKTAEEPMRTAEAKANVEEEVEAKVEVEEGVEAKAKVEEEVVEEVEEVVEEVQEEEEVEEEVARLRVESPLSRLNMWLK